MKLLYTSDMDTPIHCAHTTSRGRPNTRELQPRVNVLHYWCPTCHSLTTHNFTEQEQMDEGGIGHLTFWCDVSWWTCAECGALDYRIDQEFER